MRPDDVSVDDIDAADAPPAAAVSAPPKPWVLYLLECAGDRLYAGITNDLPARFRAHVEGRGARFTRAFPPVRIVAASELPSRSEALKAEYALKRRPRALKLRFLAGCGRVLALDESAGAGAPAERADPRPPRADPRLRGQGPRRG